MDIETSTNIVIFHVPKRTKFDVAVELHFYKARKDGKIERVEKQIPRFMQITPD